MQERQIVDIGVKLMLRALALVGVIWLLYHLQGVILAVFLAVITSIAFEPAILRIRRKGVSKTVAVIIVYAIVFVGGVGLLALFIPLLFQEFQSFARAWPQYSLDLSRSLSGIQDYFAEFGITLDQETVQNSLTLKLSDGFSNAFSFTVNLLQGIVHIVGFFFLALYLSLNDKGLEQLALIVTPDKYHKHALSIAKKIRLRISQWLYGQLILIVLAFIIYYIGLSLLGIPYALAIAIFGALMEILPYIGPILAGIPAVLIGLLVSPVLGASALAFYVVAHQIEAHALAPQVMKRSAELNPIAFILAVLIGFELAGPIGIILSVPGAMILSVFLEDLIQNKDKMPV